MEKPRISEKELNGIIESMIQKYSPPSKTVLDIKKYEQDHTEKVIEEHRQYIEIFECGYELLVDLIKTVSSAQKTNWPKHRLLQLILIKNSLYSLYSSFDRFLNGFYADSVILLRTVYETLVCVIYLSYFPEEPHFALIKNKHKKQRKFNVTNFVRDTLKVNWGFLYGVTSGYSHNSYPTILEASEITNKEQMDSIYLKLRYESEKAQLPINITVFTMWSLIKLTVLLFFECHHYIFEGRHNDKIQATDKALGEVVFAMGEKWEPMHNDILRLCNEIREKESGYNQ
jgi:hypothetical protein